jgi:hypothetical protein
MRSWQTLPCLDWRTGNTTLSSTSSTPKSSTRTAWGWHRLGFFYGSAQLLVHVGGKRTTPSASRRSVLTACSGSASPRDRVQNTGIVGRGPADGMDLRWRGIFTTFMPVGTLRISVAFMVFASLAILFPPAGAWVSTTPTSKFATGLLGRFAPPPPLKDQRGVGASTSCPGHHPPEGSTFSCEDSGSRSALEKYLG